MFFFTGLLFFLMLCANQPINFFVLVKSIYSEMFRLKIFLFDGSIKTRERLFHHK